MTTGNSKSKLAQSHDNKSKAQPDPSHVHVFVQPASTKTGLDADDVKRLALRMVEEWKCESASQKGADANKRQSEALKITARRLNAELLDAGMPHKQRVPRIARELHRSESWVARHAMKPPD